MTRHTNQTGAGLSAASLTRLALAAGAALGLAACQQHAYPSAAPQEATNAPASGDVGLAGAPTTRTPEYVPPGAPPPTGYGPNGYPPPGGYPPGYAQHGPASAPEIITMAPIPNPPEEPVRHGLRRYHHYRYAYGPEHGHAVYPYSRHHHHHRRYGMSGWVFHPAPHHGVTHARAHPALAATPASPKPAPAQLKKPAAPAHGRHHHPTMDAATATAATGGSVAATGANAMGANTMATSEADSYQALQQQLQALFTSEAKLDVPGHMDANQPATVTLTFPADFAASTQAEAAKDGLGQAVASLNLISSLSGDGYTVTPIDAQTLPLTANTPTVFQWKVTPTSATHGPLKVSARAQAAGDSHVLDLGSKTPTDDSGAGRLIGLALLAIVVVSFLAWLATRKPTKKVVIKRPPPMQFDSSN